MWDHWEVWACVKALDAQAVYVQGFLNGTGMCKCETAHFPGQLWCMDKPFSSVTKAVCVECLSNVPECATQRGTALHCIALITVKRPERGTQVNIFTTLCLGWQGPLHLWVSMQVCEVLQHAYIHMIIVDG